MALFNAIKADCLKGDSMQEDLGGAEGRYDGLLEFEFLLHELHIGVTAQHSDDCA